MRHQSVFDVNVTPLRVWTLLSDLESYRHWHPSYIFGGSAGQGARVPFTVRIFGDRQMKADVAISRFDKPSAISWKLSVFDVLGYFKETYEIEPVSDGSRIHHTYEWRGFLAVLLNVIASRGLRESIKIYDEAFFAYLKKETRSPVSANRHRRRSRSAQKTRNPV